jgi:hypothetical protein
LTELTVGRLEEKTDQKRENQKQKTDLLKTDRRSIFGLLKTDRFRFGLGFPQGSRLQLVK